MTSGTLVGQERTSAWPSLDMPRDEMAFRRRYQPMLFARTLTQESAGTDRDDARL